MKIGYITPDIQPNGHFTLFHDLLTNYPCPQATWFHRLYLVAPSWDRGLVSQLRNRYIDVRACFEEFQNSTDEWWNKIYEDTKDCDVLISGNITNLDEVLMDKIEIPIVSLSMAEYGYRTQAGTYGSFYKNRFHKVAVSKTAVNAFPEHKRDNVHVIYSGLDTSRLSEQQPRDKTRASWFPNHQDMRFMLHIGAATESKGVKKAFEALDHLPHNWHLILLSKPGEFGIPEHLHPRVHFLSPTFYVADIFNAVDCYVLPTEHEGLSMALLEAWALRCPVVTTRHNTIKELMGKHPSTDFGQLLDIDCDGKAVAEAVQQASPSESARDCVYQNYMATNMVSQWKDYLERITGRT